MVSTRLPWESSGPSQLSPPPGIGIFSISKASRVSLWNDGFLILSGTYLLPGERVAYV